MKRICYLPLMFLIISCSSQTTQGSEITIIPDTKSTLIATSPSLISDSKATLIATSPSVEITFDGNECKFHGANEITIGEHVFLLHNQSGHRSFLIVGRLFAEKSWDDYLQWFEDNCGPPGSTCEGEPPWLAWLFPVKSADQGLDKRYWQYDLNLEAEYLTVVDDGGFWLCNSFKVVTAQ